jgi:hypothetical protein
MAAIYRIAHDGWSADQALAEMKQFHFHQGFEDGNSDFVKRFASYWQALPAESRKRVLHQA